MQQIACEGSWRVIETRLQVKLGFIISPALYADKVIDLSSAEIL